MMIHKVIKLSIVFIFIFCSVRLKSSPLITEVNKNNTNDYISIYRWNLKKKFTNMNYTSPSGFVAK